MSVEEHYTGLQVLTLQRLFIEVFFIMDVENTACCWDNYLTGDNVRVLYIIYNPTRTTILLGQLSSLNI